MTTGSFDSSVLVCYNKSIAKDLSKTTTTKKGVVFMTTENKKTYVIKDDNDDTVIGVLLTDRNSTEVYDLITKAYDISERQDIGQTYAFKSLLSDDDFFTEDTFTYYM